MALRMLGETLTSIVEHVLVAQALPRWQPALFECWDAPANSASCEWESARRQMTACSAAVSASTIRAFWDFSARLLPKRGGAFSGNS